MSGSFERKQTPKVGGTKEVISPEELKILTGDDDNFPEDSENTEWIAYQRKLRDDYQERYVMIRNWLSHETNYLRNIARMEVAAREKRYTKRLKRFHLLCERGWQLLATESKIREADYKERKANQEKRCKELEKQWEADNRKLYKRKKMRRAMLSKKLGKAKTARRSPTGEKEDTGEEFKSSWDLETSIKSLTSEFEERDATSSKLADIEERATPGRLSTETGEIREHHGKKKQKASTDDSSKFRKKRIHFAKDISLSSEDQASKKIRTDDFTSSTTIEIPGVTWSETDVSQTTDALSKLVLDDYGHSIHSIPVEPGDTTSSSQDENMEYSSFGEMSGLIFPTGATSSKEFDHQDRPLHSTLLPDQYETDLDLRPKYETEEEDMSEDSDLMSTSELDMYIEEISAVQDILGSDIPLEDLQDEIEAKTKISSKWPRVTIEEISSDRDLTYPELLVHPTEQKSSTSDQTTDDILKTVVKRPYDESTDSSTEFLDASSEEILRKIKAEKIPESPVTEISRESELLDESVRHESDHKQTFISEHSVSDSDDREKEPIKDITGTYQNLELIQGEKSEQDHSYESSEDITKTDESFLIQYADAGRDAVADRSESTESLHKPEVAEATVYFSDDKLEAEKSITKGGDKGAVVRISVDEDNSETERIPEEQRESYLSPIPVDIDTLISRITDAQHSLRSESELILEGTAIPDRERTGTEIKPVDKRVSYEPRPEHVVLESDEQRPALQTAGTFIDDGEGTEEDDDRQRDYESYVEPEHLVSEKDKRRSVLQTTEIITKETREDKDEHPKEFEKMQEHSLEETDTGKTEDVLHRGKVEAAVRLQTTDSETPFRFTDAEAGQSVSSQELDVSDITLGTKQQVQISEYIYGQPTEDEKYEEMEEEYFIEDFDSAAVLLTLERVKDEAAKVEHRMTVEKDSDISKEILLGVDDAEIRQPVPSPELDSFQTMPTTKEARVQISEQEDEYRREEEKSKDIQEEFSVKDNTSIELDKEDLDSTAMSLKKVKDEAAKAEHRMTAEEDSNISREILLRVDDAKIRQSVSSPELDSFQATLETNEVRMQISEQEDEYRREEEKSKDIQEESSVKAYTSVELDKEDLDSTAMSVTLEKVKDEASKAEHRMTVEKDSDINKEILLGVDDAEIRQPVPSPELDSFQTMPTTKEARVQISEQEDEYRREEEKSKDIQEEFSVKADTSVELDTAKDESAVDAADARCEHRTSEKEMLLDGAEVGLPILSPRLDVSQSMSLTHDSQFILGTEDQEIIPKVADSKISPASLEIEVHTIDADTDIDATESECFLPESKESNIPDQLPRVSFTSTLPTHKSEISNALTTEKAHSQLRSWETVYKAVFPESAEKTHMRYRPRKDIDQSDRLFRGRKSALKRKFDHISVDVSSNIESSSGVAYDEGASSPKIPFVKQFFDYSNVDFISSLPTYKLKLKSIENAVPEDYIYTYSSQGVRLFEDTGKDLREKTGKESVEAAKESVEAAKESVEAAKDSEIYGKDTETEETLFEPPSDDGLKVTEKVLISEASLKIFVPQKGDDKIEKESFIACQETYFLSSFPSYIDFSKDDIFEYIPQDDLSLIFQGSAEKHDTGVRHDQKVIVDRQTDSTTCVSTAIWPSPTYTVAKVFDKDLIEPHEPEMALSLSFVPPKETQKPEDEVVDFTESLVYEVKPQECIKEPDSAVSAEKDLSSERTAEIINKEVKTSLLLESDPKHKIVDAFEFISLTPSYRKAADNTRQLLSKHCMGICIPQDFLPLSKRHDHEAKKPEPFEGEEVRFTTAMFDGYEYHAQDIEMLKFQKTEDLQGRFVKPKLVFPDLLTDLYFLYDFPAYSDLSKTEFCPAKRRRWIEKGTDDRDGDESFPFVGNIDREKLRDLAERTREGAHEIKDELRETKASSLNGKKKPEVISGESLVSGTASDTSQKEMMERLQNLRQMLATPVMEDEAEFDEKRQSGYGKRRHQIKSLIKFHTGELANLFSESVQLVADRSGEQEDKAGSSRDFASGGSSTSLLTAEQDLCDAMDRYFNEIGEESSGDEKEFSQFFKTYKEELIRLRSETSIPSAEEEDRQYLTPSGYSVKQRDPQKFAFKSDVDQDSYHDDTTDSFRSTSSGTVSPGEASSRVTITPTLSDDEKENYSEERENILENVRDLEQLYERMKQRSGDVQLTSVRLFCHGSETDRQVDALTERDKDSYVQEGSTESVKRPAREKLQQYPGDKYKHFDFELFCLENQPQKLRYRRRIKDLGIKSQDYHEDRLTVGTDKSSGEEDEGKTAYLDNLARKRKFRDPSLHYLEELLENARRKDKYKTYETGGDDSCPTSDMFSDHEEDKSEARKQLKAKRRRIKDQDLYFLVNEFKWPFKKHLYEKSRADSEKGSFATDGESCQDLVEIERSPITNLGKFNKNEWSLFLANRTAAGGGTEDSCYRVNYDKEIFNRLMSAAILQHQRYLRDVICDRKSHSPEQDGNELNGTEWFMREKQEEPLQLEKSADEHFKTPTGEQNIYFLYSEPHYKSYYADISQVLLNFCYQNFEAVIQRAQMITEKDTEDLIEGIEIMKAGKLPRILERTILEDSKARARRRTLLFETNEQPLQYQFVLSLDEKTVPARLPELSFTYSNPKYQRESSEELKTIMTSESELLVKLIEHIQADHQKEKATSVRISEHPFAQKPMKGHFDVAEETAEHEPVSGILKSTERIKMKIRKHVQILQPEVRPKKSVFDRIGEPLRGQIIDFTYSEPQYRSIHPELGKLLSHPCYQNFEMVLLMAQMRSTEDVEDAEIVELGQGQRTLEEKNGDEDVVVVNREKLLRDLGQRLPSSTCDILLPNEINEITVSPEFNFMYSIPKYDTESTAILKAIMTSESEFLRKLVQNISAEAEAKTFRLREGVFTEYGIRESAKEPSVTVQTVKEQYDYYVKDVSLDKELPAPSTLEDQLTEDKIFLRVSYDYEISSGDLYFTYSSPTHSKYDILKLESSMIYCSEAFQTSLADLRSRTAEEKMPQVECIAHQDEKMHFGFKKEKPLPKKGPISPIISIQENILPSAEEDYKREEKSLIPAEKVPALSTLVDYDKISLYAPDDYEINSSDLYFTYSRPEYSKDDLHNLQDAMVFCFEDIQIVLADLRLQISEDERKMQQDGHITYRDDKTHFCLSPKMEILKQVLSVSWNIPSSTGEYEAEEKKVVFDKRLSTLVSQLTHDNTSLHTLSEGDVSSRDLYFTYASPGHSKDDFDKLQSAMIYDSEAFQVSCANLLLQTSEKREASQSDYIADQEEKMRPDLEKWKLPPKMEIKPVSSGSQNILRLTEDYKEETQIPGEKVTALSTLVNQLMRDKISLSPLDDYESASGYLYFTYSSPKYLKEEFYEQQDATICNSELFRAAFEDLLVPVSVKEREATQDTYTTDQNEEMHFDLEKQKLSPEIKTLTSLLSVRKRILRTEKYKDEEKKLIPAENIPVLSTVIDEKMHDEMSLLSVRDYEVSSEYIFFTYSSPKYSTRDFHRLQNAVVSRSETFQIAFADVLRTFAEEKEVSPDERIAHQAEKFQFGLKISHEIDTQPPDISVTKQILSGTVESKDKARSVILEAKESDLSPPEDQLTQISLDSLCDYEIGSGNLYFTYPSPLYSKDSFHEFQGAIIYASEVFRTILRELPLLSSTAVLAAQETLPAKKEPVTLSKDREGLVVSLKKTTKDVHDEWSFGKDKDEGKLLPHFQFWAEVLQKRPQSEEKPAIGIKREICKSVPVSELETTMTNFNFLYSVPLHKGVRDKSILMLDSEVIQNLRKKPAEVTQDIKQQFEKLQTSPEQYESDVSTEAYRAVQLSGVTVDSGSFCFIYPTPVLMDSRKRVKDVSPKSEPFEKIHDFAKEYITEHFEMPQLVIQDETKPLDVTEIPSPRQPGFPLVARISDEADKMPLTFDEGKPLRMKGKTSLRDGSDSRKLHETKREDMALFRDDKMSLKTETTERVAFPLLSRHVEKDESSFGVGTPRDECSIFESVISLSSDEIGFIYSVPLLRTRDMDKMETIMLSSSDTLENIILQLRTPILVPQAKLDDSVLLRSVESSAEGTSYKHKWRQTEKLIEKRPSHVEEEVKPGREREEIVHSITGEMLPLRDDKERKISFPELLSREIIVPLITSQEFPLRKQLTISSVQPVEREMTQLAAETSLTSETELYFVYSRPLFSTAFDEQVKKIMPFDHDTFLKLISDLGVQTTRKVPEERTAVGFRETWSVTAPGRDMPFEETRSTTTVVPLEETRSTTPAVPFEETGSTTAAVPFEETGSTTAAVPFEETGSTTPAVPFEETGSTTPAVPFEETGSTTPAVPFEETQTPAAVKPAREREEIVHLITGEMLPLRDDKERKISFPELPSRENIVPLITSQEFPLRKQLTISSVQPVEREMAQLAAETSFTSETELYFVYSRPLFSTAFDEQVTKIMTFDHDTFLKLISDLGVQTTRKVPEERTAVGFREPWSATAPGRDVPFEETRSTTTVVHLKETRSTTPAVPFEETRSSAAVKPAREREEIVHSITGEMLPLRDDKERKISFPELPSRENIVPLITSQEFPLRKQLSISSVQPVEREMTPLAAETSFTSETELYFVYSRPFFSTEFDEQVKKIVPFDHDTFLKLISDLGVQTTRKDPEKRTAVGFRETWSATEPGRAAPFEETRTITAPMTVSFEERSRPITPAGTKVEVGQYGARKLEPEVKKEVRPYHTITEIGIPHHRARQIKDERVSEFKCEHEGILTMSEAKQDSLDGGTVFRQRMVKEQLIFPLQPQQAQATDSAKEQASVFECEKKGLLPMSSLRLDKTGEGTLSTDILVKERDLLPGGSHDQEDASQFHKEVGLIQVTTARPDRLGEGTLLTDRFVEEKRLLSENVKLEEQSPERDD